MRLESHYGDRVVPCFQDRPSNLYQLLEHAVAQNAKGDALVCGADRLSYAQLQQQSSRLATGLSKRGVKVGDRVAMLLGNRNEFVVTLFALAHLGAIAVPISIREQAPGLAYMLSHCAAVMVIHEADLASLLPSAQDAPNLQHRVSMAPCQGSKLYEQLLEDGECPPVAAVAQEDTAVILYTSGTTGKPKGAMHSHAGLVYAVRGFNTLARQDARDDRMCFLPLCHIVERIGGEYHALYTGAVLNFVENPETIPENVREIAPTVFVAVPRVWEKFYSSVMIALKESSPLQQMTYAWGIGVGQRIAEQVLAQQAVSWVLKCQFTLARWLVLNNVRKLIGIHRARMLISGAAPISPSLIKWYLSLGVPMLEAWGMTETCGASTAMTAARIKPGSIGPAAGFNEVRLDPITNEILVRGPNVFMGYLNLPDKTAEALDADGWLHTGDVGEVDADGYFRITDRMKDIIITAGGKNITPSEFENELKFSPYITDAVLIGDQRPYLTAIIMIDQDNVEKFAQDHDVPFSNYASLTQSQAVLDLIQSVVDQANAQFARVEQVKKFWLLDTQLSAEDEELTPTMKLKRQLVQKKYAPHIEAMYRP